jgi:hypothetical protein
MPPLYNGLFHFTTDLRWYSKANGAAGAAEQYELQLRMTATTTILSMYELDDGWSTLYSGTESQYRTHGK